MTDTPLVTPDQVEDVLVDVLRRRHPEHLARLERDRGLAPETIERFRTVTHLASEAAVARLSGDVLPAALLGVIGAGGEPSTTELDRLNVPMQVGVQVSVQGQRRRDTLRRRDWMAWSTVECLLQRTQGVGPIASIHLTDWEPIDEGDSQRVLAEARLIFTVTVADAVAVRGGLPADNTAWPPGGPNGPPATPYEPPADPPLAISVQATVDKERIA